MPIVHFHLVEGASTPEQERRLLTEGSALYARILDCPIDRIRAFILSVPPARAATAGRIVEAGGAVAPYFEVLALEGRPLDQRQALLAGFTDLIAETLGVDKALIRGQCKRVDPDDWSIGGTPASAVRRNDIAAFSAGPDR